MEQKRTGDPMTLPHRIEAAEGADWDSIPNVRKVGRYTFFAACAFGLGVTVGLPFLALGVAKDTVHGIANISAIASFLALRDMSKQWDAVLCQRAAALRAKESSDGE
jgi:hypothetical protein